jgi:hypothetical protein
MTDVMNEDWYITISDILEQCSHFDSRALVRRFISPKGHSSEGSLVRKDDSPKGQWSELSVAQKYLKNQTKGHM